MPQPLESNDHHAVPSGLPPAATADRRLDHGSGGREPAGGADTWADAARREVHLLRAGLSGFREAAVDAFKSENLPMTAGKVALSVGLAFTLGRLRPISAVAQSLLRSAGMAAGLSFSMDVAANGWEVGKAMADAAGTNPNLQKDSDVMKRSLGQFAFDTALTAPFAIGSGVLGNRLAKAATAAETLAARALKSSSERMDAKAPRSLMFARDEEAAESTEHQAIRTFADLQLRGFTPPLLMARSPLFAESLSTALKSAHADGATPVQTMEMIGSTLNGLHRQSGLPQLLEARVHSDPGLVGSFHSGSMFVGEKYLDSWRSETDPVKLLTERAKLTSYFMHEDEHLEQEALMLRRIADRIGIGKDWLRSDIDAVIQAHPNTQAYSVIESMGGDIYRLNPDFIQNVLRLRAGQSLSPGLTARSDMLLDSIRFPARRDLLLNYDSSARHFMSQIHDGHFENSIDAAAMMDKPWSYPPLRTDIQRINALAQANPKMTASEIGMEIYHHSEQRLQDIEAELAGLPQYGQYAHEAEAYAVERRGFDHVVNTDSPAGAGTLPTWWQLYTKSAGA